jgi:serine protease inhibitor
MSKGPQKRKTPNFQLDVALRQQNENLRNSNVVFSPLSIASVLALVLLAAEGRTKDEVSHVLGLRAVSDETHLLYGNLLNEFTSVNGKSFSEI